MNSLRSPTWSVYDGEGDAFDLNGSAGEEPYVPYVSEAPPFLRLRSSGLKKEALIRYGTQSAVYAAYEKEHAKPVERGAPWPSSSHRFGAVNDPSAPPRPPRFAVKRLFTQKNDFGIRGIPETALREVALLRWIQQKQDALLGTKTHPNNGTNTEESPLDVKPTQSFGFSGTCDRAHLDSTACILTLQRVVEAPHKELCLVMELCAMDLSRVVISHAKKFTACQNLDLAQPFLQPSSLPSASVGERNAFVRPRPDTIHHVDRRRCPILSQMCVVRYLLRRLLHMVCFLHEECGIIHRDLKLSNILITQDGDLRLSDFGSARFRMPRLPSTSTDARGSEMMYTPATIRTTKIYQSPECLLGDCLYSTTIDMWSVGIIFGEFIRQSHLLHGESELAVLGEIWKLLGETPAGEARSESHSSSSPSPNALPPKPTVEQCSSEDPFNQAPSSNTTTEETGLRSKFPPSVLSEEGFDLLRQMLSLDPARRISAREALGHPFLKFEGDHADDDAGNQLWRQKVVEILNSAQESVAVRMPLLEEDDDDDVCNEIPKFEISLR